MHSGKWEGVVGLTTPPQSRHSPALAVTGVEGAFKHSRAAGETLAVVLVREAAELAVYAAAWEDLAAAAAEPNVFYEPWLLLPALQAFGAGKDLRFVLVFASSPEERNGARRLCGFFPLERLRSYKGLPLSLLRLWQHVHCQLCTPLIRDGYLREVLAAFLAWLAADPESTPLLQFAWISGDGPFYQALIAHCYQHAVLSYQQECFTRALLRPQADAQTYLQMALAGKRLRELKRQEKRLAELGQLSYTLLDPAADAGAWIESFLHLENSGWKGRAISSIAASESSKSYFQTVIREAARRRRLQALSLCLNGQPIAQRCSLLAGPGSFALKTAFDENYARYSPGALLELETIRRLHAAAGLHWMDSCAAWNNELLNHLWIDRRTLQDVLLATGKSPGELLVSTLPLLKWLKRKLNIPT